MPQTRLYHFRLSPFAFLVGGRRDERVKIWEEARGHILLGKDQDHDRLREESVLRFESYLGSLRTDYVPLNTVV